MMVEMRRKLNGNRENYKESNSRGRSQSKLSEHLKSSRFRYINEQLYTTDGNTAAALFENDATAFHIYHEGFVNQAKIWPKNPLDAVIATLAKKPENHVVADMGCGEARLARSLKQKVHSFDLVALNETVTACNMSKVPLVSESVNDCIFCLSLMGTNLADYLREANRILRLGGSLYIAEIKSRISSVRDFERALSKLGFHLMNKKELNDYFLLFEFEKIGKPRNKKPPGLQLKPCLYKKR